MKRISQLLIALLAFVSPFSAFAFIDPTLNYAVENNVSVGSDVTDAIATDGEYLYLTGYTESPGDAALYLEKRNLSDGSLVYATSSNPTGSGSETYTDLALGGDYIYLVGQDQTGGNVGWRFEKRAKSDGSLVYATTSNPSSGTDSPTGIDIDSSYMYVVGYDVTAGNNEWRFEKRNLSDGALVYYATTSISAFNTEIAHDIVIDSSYMYVVGADRPGGQAGGRLEKRNLSDGSLVYATSSNPSASWDGFYRVSLSNNFLYLTGVDNTPGGYDYAARLEKRSVSDGSLVYGVSANIVVADPVEGGEDQYWQSRVIGDRIYIGGVSYGDGWATTSAMLAVHAESDGALLYSDIFNSSSQWSRILNMVAVDTSLFTVGEYYSSSYSAYMRSYNLAPAPTVSSFSPSSDTIKAGSEAQTLTINGTNFSASTTALTWKGSAKTATFVSSTQMTVNFSTSDLEADGRFTLTIPNDYSIADDESFTYEIAQEETSSGSGGGGGFKSKKIVVEESETPADTSNVRLFVFLKNLKYLQVDPDVQELQKFLNKSGFPVSLEGPGSAGNETTMFGALTKAALIKFQEANADAILKPNNLTKGTGYFGPSTRAFVNSKL